MLLSHSTSDGGYLRFALLRGDLRSGGFDRYLRTTFNGFVKGNKNKAEGIRFT